MGNKIFLLLFATLLTINSQACHAESLKIGLLLCQTGSCAEWGNAGIQGAQLAAEEINAAGGIDGMQVELKVEDSSEDNINNVLSAYRNLRNKGVSYIVGPTWSPAGNALAPIAKKDSGVIMVSPSLGVRDFNETAENLFNVWPHDEYNARRMAAFALEQGIKNVAIMGAQQPWSQTQSAAFQEEFERGGGLVVLRVDPLPESRDLRIEATKIARSDAEAVLFTCFAEQMGVAAAQLQQLGFYGTKLSVLMYDSAIGSSQGALEGSLYAAYPPPGDEFTAKFKKRFGMRPGTSADTAYDAVKLISIAAAKNPSDNIKMVRNTLAATKDYKGASGTLTFSAVRGVVATPTIFQVQSGRMGLAFNASSPAGLGVSRAQLKRGSP